MRCAAALVLLILASCDNSARETQLQLTTLREKASGFARRHKYDEAIKACDEAIALCDRNPKEFTAERERFTVRKADLETEKKNYAEYLNLLADIRKQMDMIAEKEIEDLEREIAHVESLLPFARENGDEEELQRHLRLLKQLLEQKKKALAMCCVESNEFQSYTAELKGKGDSVAALIEYDRLLKEETHDIHKLQVSTQRAILLNDYRNYWKSQRDSVKALLNAGKNKEAVEQWTKLRSMTTYPDDEVKTVLDAIGRLFD